MSRQLWFITLQSGRIERILGVSTDPAERPERIDYGRCPSPRDRWYLVAHHGFRVSQAADRRTVIDAHEALKKHLGWEPEYDSSMVLLNKDFTFFPIGWIGCGGALVEHAWGTVRLLAAIEPVGVQVWAHYRGFPVFDQKGQDRLIDLVVTAVRDVGQAFRVLGLLRSDANAETIREGLARLPMVFSGIDVFFELHHLWQAEAHGWFTFHPRAMGASESA